MEDAEAGSTDPMTRGRFIALGDIHGCIFALDAILAALELGPSDHLICLGDCIDTGRNSKEVVDRLIEVSQLCDLQLIRGNHEEMFLASLEDPKVVQAWLNCGGMETVNSYRFCGSIEDIPKRHIEFIQQSVDYVETSNAILVHANYEPDENPADWPVHTLRWSILDESSPRPHTSGKRVIVGHTEQRHGEILDLGYLTCIDTYCHGSGWLTALDLQSGKVWQASRWGVLRERLDDGESLLEAHRLLHEDDSESDAS